MDWPDTVDALAAGQIELVVGGIATTPRRATQVTFSNPYIDHTAGFVMLDDRRDAVDELDKVQDLAGLRILIIDDPY